MIQAVLKKLSDDNTGKYKFEYRDSQIFAILKSTRAMLDGDFGDEYKDDREISKGIIYQIDTGEGKSSIIKSLAAILAGNKKKVHIVTSNIELAKRDFFESQDFFDFFHLKSDVLIHERECANKEADSGADSKIIMPKNTEWDKASGMNIKALDEDVVFSTFLNFEGAFLHFQENNPEEIDKISRRILIIDEADSMLIDEITNGTILSKQIKSNTKEVLTKFYEEAKARKSPGDDKNEHSDKVKKDLEEIRVKLNKYFEDNIIDCILTEKDIVAIFEDYCDAMDKTAGREYIISNKEFDSKEEKQKAIDKKEPIKEIIPFDFEHKGMAEPTKEFMGYIQEFIAIKENDYIKEEIELRENQGEDMKANNGIITDENTKDVK